MNDTIWGVTEDDFRGVIEEYFPYLDERQIKHIIERARRKLDIPEWFDAVVTFIETQLDEVEGWEDEE